MKVLFNNCFGGFGLSEKAIQLYNERKGTNYTSRWELTDEVPRTDETLIQIVEELRAEANSECAELAIAEVPDGAYYTIDEYDGAESVTYTLTPPPEVFSAKVIKTYKRKED